MTSRARYIGWAGGLSAGLALPLLASLSAVSVLALLATLITIAGFLAAKSLRTNRYMVVLSVTAMIVDGWLLTQASAPGNLLLLAPGLGLALGLAYGGQLSPLRPAVPIGIAIVAALTLFGLVAGPDAAVFSGLCLAVAGCIPRLREPGARLLRRSASLQLSGLVLLTMAPLCVIGATTPRAVWFGQLTYHGPRQSNQVAITFDDGPDEPYSLQIRDILDAHGVKATFFTVGKALAARPDISKALLDDGQELGNHSYNHNDTAWLSPGYPELQQTQAAFQRDLGVCPAFFRPPHGTHTPFMSRVVNGADMTVVNWDVSAGDWATSDADLVAQRVLAKVRPGSIILLHDGIDGSVTADRSVILAALPQILDGLKQRGLEPVTLAMLLNRPAYIPCQP